MNAARNATVLTPRFVNPMTDRPLHVLEQARLFASHKYLNQSIRRGGPQGKSVFTTCRSISDFSSKLREAVHYLISATDHRNRRLLDFPLGKIHIQIFGQEQAIAESFQLYAKFAGKALEEKRALLIPDTEERRVYCSGTKGRDRDWVLTGFIESFDLEIEDITAGNAPSILALPMVKPNGVRVGVVLVEGFRKEFIKPHVDMIAFSRLGLHAAENFNSEWS